MSKALRLPSKVAMEISKALCLPRNRQLIFQKPCKRHGPVTQSEFQHFSADTWKSLSGSGAPATQNDITHLRRGEVWMVARTKAASSEHASAPKPQVKREPFPPHSGNIICPVQSFDSSKISIHLTMAWWERNKLQWLVVLTDPK